MIAGGRNRSVEPWVSLFYPSELVRRLQEMGFAGVSVVRVRIIELDSPATAPYNVGNYCQSKTTIVIDRVATSRHL